MNKIQMHLCIHHSAIKCKYKCYNFIKSNTFSTGRAQHILCNKKWTYQLRRRPKKSWTWASGCTSGWSIWSSAVCSGLSSQTWTRLERSSHGARGSRRWYPPSSGCDSSCGQEDIGVNRPAIVREIPHFCLFPAFPHFCKNVPHFWLYF